MSKATENDDNDEGLTINITHDNAEEAFGEFAEKRKGNPRKRVVQRGQKKWMGGKQKRIDFELKDANKNGKRNGNKTGDDSDFERKGKSFLNDQNERESSGEREDFERKCRVWDFWDSYSSSSFKYKK